MNQRNSRFNVTAFAAGGLCLGAMALALMALRQDASGVYAAIDHIWSDWPLHAGMALQFADAPPSLWLANHPMIAGHPLHYPFVVNLASGLLMRVGLNFVPAMLAPTVLAVGAALALLFVWLRRLAVPGPWAVVGLALVVMSGGTGVCQYVADGWTLGVWSWPAKAYSRLTEYGWHTGNILVGLWIPQRAFAPGVAVAMLGLCTLMPHLAAFGARPCAAWTRLFSRHSQRATQLALLAAGGLIGCLPLIHMHSAICVWGLIGVLTITRPARWRAILPFSLVAASISLAIWLLHLRHGVTAAKFLSWRPGFEAEGKGLLAWAAMWGKIWGPYLLVAFAGAILVVRRPRHFADRPLALGGWTLFGLANLIQFQPVSWDNSKMFVWSYLALLPAVLSALERAWRREILRLPVVLTFAAMTLTGALDVMAYVKSAVDGGMQIWNADEVEVAARVRRETLPGSSFATVTAHNHPVMGLAGRPILVGFTPWVANFGVDPEPRVEALKSIFGGGEIGLAAARAWHVDYVYLGPGEVTAFHADSLVLDYTFRLVFATRGVKLYRVPQAPAL